jgi:hypothetical protein
LKIDDLIAKAVSRRSDINAATMKASYEILKEVALEEVCSAKQVEFGLSHYKLGVNGIFVGDHPAWDRNVHCLLLHSSATAEARQALKNIEVEVLGMAQSGIYINSVTDVISGETNASLTPGGALNIAGARIKIAGDAPEVGLFLTEINSGATVPIPSTSIALNEPSKITCVIPADLPAGDYRLKIVTQFAHSILLKEPRSCILDYILACNA